MISESMARRMRLRPAQASDAESIADIYLAARLRHLSFAPLVHSVAEVRAWVRDILLVSHGVTVAEVHGRPVGFIAVSTREGAGWIDQLYVHPACIGCGMGSLLLEDALSHLPHPVRLYTFQQNQRAQRFYERRGFTAIEFSDGSNNEERCPDILYELRVTADALA